MKSSSAFETVKIPSPWGTFQLLISEKGLHSLSFPGNSLKKFPSRRGARGVSSSGKKLHTPSAAAATPLKRGILVKKIQGEFKRYFKGIPVSFANFKFDLSGYTPFQAKVIRELSKINSGELASYKQIAASIKHSKAYRAVGSALNKNRLPIILPCHRVVSSKGLGGYALGLPWKRRLLNLEKIPSVPGVHPWHRQRKRTKVTDKPRFAMIRTLQ